MNATTVIAQLSPLERLLQTLLLVISLQVLGYTFKRTGTMAADRAPGLGFFVANIALPSLLFRSLATLDVSILNFALVGAILFSKVIVFGLAAGLGWALTKKEEAPGSGLLSGGLFALCCTVQSERIRSCALRALCPLPFHHPLPATTPEVARSNRVGAQMSDDVGLGFPLLSALFVEEAQLLFILSALQAALFNTAAFILLGVGKARSTQTEGAGAQQSVGSVVLGVIGNLRKNFLVVSVGLGTVWRLLIGPTLPSLVDSFTRTCGQAFTPLVLYLAGCASVGTFGKLARLQSAVLPAALGALQSLLLPILCRTFTAAFGGTDQAQGFAFVYGILPCANSVLVIAQSYQLPPPMLTTVASYLALGKLLAFPYLLLAAVTLNVTRMDAGGVTALRQGVSQLMLGLSIAAVTIFVLVALLIPAYRRCPLRRVLCLAALQGAFALCHIVPAPASASGRTVLHMLVAWLRWAINGFVGVLAVDQARKALALRKQPSSAVACPVAVGAAADGGLGHARMQAGDIGMGTHLLVSLAAGGVMSLPFAIGCGAPAKGCLLLFLPYTNGCAPVQKSLYAVAYAAHALLLVACLGLVLYASQTRPAQTRGPATARLEALASPPPSPASSPAEAAAPPPPSLPPSPPPVGSCQSVAGQGPLACDGRGGADVPGGVRSVTGAGGGAGQPPPSQGPFLPACQGPKRIGTKLRLRMTIAVFVLRSAFSAAFVISLLGVNDCSELGAAAGGSQALLLLLLVLLVDGQGLITTLLFAAQPELYAAALGVASRVRVSLFDSTAFCRQCCAATDALRGEHSLILVEDDATADTADGELAQQTLLGEASAERSI